MFIDEENEKVAKAIYEAFERYDGIAKPKWVGRGNSLKQDEARKFAQIAINILKSEK